MTLRLPLLALALLAGPASAQMLPSGTWTGTLEHGGDAHPAQAEIERCTGGFTVALDVAGRRADVTEDGAATWEGGRLRFETSRARWPGLLLPRALACSLEQDTETGALAGVCRAGRTTYRLRLAPPASGSFGCK
ncbi:hypothetical protein RQM47_03960 [Rubrivirga sp. S365]|uniref:Uncharacterized protein n=1 Tax=Rubrivirga litoralis TaxID=3075598 RepID=A0ABU3BLW3_9BACT|nr:MULTISPECIES: hypothetical protein [unclassified Rubrivirga]MDT0630277.1 hypothetical protein [Rubrivirga sp. F394]MDT7855789.1 hypothetical protein [Rubrivirga sp. S365]